MLKLIAEKRLYHINLGKIERKFTSPNLERSLNYYRDLEKMAQP
jgi:hypothetical protein